MGEQYIYNEIDMIRMGWRIIEDSWCFKNNYRMDAFIAADIVLTNLKLDSLKLCGERADDGMNKKEGE